MTGEVARFPDSTGWLAPGPWDRSNRIGPVPFVFQVAGRDGVRVFAQAVVGAIAWSMLAVTVSTLAHLRRTAVAAVLVLSLAPQVIRYDVAILSESLGISFAVLAVASTLRLVHRSDPAGWAMFVGAGSLCGLTRPTHLVVLAAVAAACVIAAARVRDRTRIAAAVAASTVLLVGLILLHGNRTTSELNVYTVLAADVLPDDARTQWFVEAGMPLLDGMRDVHGYEDPASLPPDLRHAAGLPVGQMAPSLVRAGGARLLRWVQEDGATTIAQYLVTHPGDTFQRLGQVAPSVLSPHNGDFLPVSTRSPVPWSWFGAWTWWIVALIMSTVVLLVRGRGRQAAALIAMAAITAMLFAASMLWSGLERPRHGVASAVLVRVLGLSAVAIAIRPRHRRAFGGDRVASIVEPKPACRASSDV